jgi:hypothetical protein
LPDSSVGTLVEGSEVDSARNSSTRGSNCLPAVGGLCQELSHWRKGTELLASSVGTLVEGSEVDSAGNSVIGVKEPR